MIGIIVDNLATSQLSYLLSVQANKRQDVYLYSREMFPLIQRITCPVFPMRDAVHNHELLIATSLDTANFLRKLPTPSRKIYYPWSIEWLNHGNNFLYSSPILNSKMEIVARSKDYARQLQISGHCNAIIEDFDLNAFLQYVKDHERQDYYINNGDFVR